MPSLWIMRQILVSCLTIFLATLGTCAKLPANQDKEIGQFFKGLSGTFVMLDLQNNRYTVYNRERAMRRVSPLSTFKVPNALIALDLGKLSGPDEVIKWDGVKRRPEWDRDHTLRSAIKYSVVPYFQEVARRVGESSYKEYLKKFDYGNQDISGGLTTFWLATSLKISPMEQVSFLKKLVLNQLPVSQRAMDIVRDITVLERTPQYVVHGKIGFGPDKETGQTLGWFIGYVTKGSNTYIFAANAEGKNPDLNADFVQNIVMKILKQLGILPS